MGQARKIGLICQDSLTLSLSQTGGHASAGGVRYPKAPGGPDDVNRPAGVATPPSARNRLLAGVWAKHASVSTG